MSNFAQMTRADFDQLSRSAGIHMMGMDAARILNQSERMQLAALAADAVPAAITTSSGAIPWFLANYIDPRIIEILFAPTKAANILGESKRGDWTARTAMFPVVEATGEVSSYGDYSNSGSAGANPTFPERQSYHYQTITQWGEKYLAETALAKIDWASQVNEASVKILNRFQNQSYFFGVSGLQNYGLLNDPALPAALSPGTKTAGNGNVWIYNGNINATANEVFADIQSMVQEVINTNQGLVTMDSKMTLAMSSASEVALTATTQYNVNVEDMMKKNFPNMRVVTAPQYASANNGGLGGNLVQLIVDEVDGQPTGTCGFTEKLRAHPIIREMSAFRQKKSQGTWGAIIWRPASISQMLGV